MVRSFVLFFVVLLALSGCARSTSPRLGDASTLSGAGLAAVQLDREPGSFYPLVSGNRWTYDREFFTALRPLGDTVTYRGRERMRVVRTVDCPTTFDGSIWWVETSRTYTVNSLIIEWLRMRQDRNGLYELETIPTPEYPCGDLGSGSASIAEQVVRPLRASGPGTSGIPLAPGRAEGALIAAFRRALEPRLSAMPGSARWLDPRPDGIGTTVLTRLAYPLRVGAEWAIRPEVDVNHEPIFLAHVEAQETIDLPAGRFPAYRIRIDSPLFRPGDVVQVWYGRAGFLALHADVTFSIEGEGGQVIGEGHAIDEVRLAAIGE